MELWNCVSVELLDIRGATFSRTPNYSLLTLWNCGIVELLNCETVEALNCGSVELWNCKILTSLQSPVSSLQTFDL